MKEKQDNKVTVGIISNKTAIYLLGLFLFFLLVVLPLFKSGNKKSNTVNNSIVDTTVSIKFPISGKEIATLDNPVKAYLDPENSYTRVLGSGNAKYVLESDTSKFFIVNEKPEVLDSSGRIKAWLVMPAGNYLIYPYPPFLDSRGIVFKWWLR